MAHSLLKDGIYVLPDLYDLDIPKRLGPVKRETFKTKYIIDPTIASLFLPLIEEYYGEPPKWIEAEYVKSWPSDNHYGSALWHRDHHEGNRFCVCMNYLCDVTEFDGPLSYVPGTQRGGWREPKTYDRLSDAAFEKLIPRSEWMPIVGPKGTTFVFDTLGYHRGGHNISGPREVLLFAYHTK